MSDIVEDDQPAIDTNDKLDEIISLLKLIAAQNQETWGSGLTLEDQE